MIAIRLLFVLIPAIVLGGIVGAFNETLGILAFAAVAMLGYGCTEPRLERGEGNDNNARFPK